MGGEACVFVGEYVGVVVLLLRGKKQKILTCAPGP